MRTFIIRARKGTTRWDKVRSHVGTKEHFEVIAHSIMNAFFISNGFRNDVIVYLVLDSSDDFPRTIRLSSGEGLSITGFHEIAIIDLIENALKNSVGLIKNETHSLAPGLQILGFGFEKLIAFLSTTHAVYLLDPKGDDIRTVLFEQNPVFILSDHLTMPKNNVKALKRQGVNTIALGKKMLFASQCIVLLNDAIDRCI